MNYFRKIYQPSQKTTGGLLRRSHDVHRDEGWINPWRLHYLALVISALTFWWLVSGALAQTPPYPSCVNYAGLKNTTCALYASAIDPEGDPIYYIYSWGDGTADTRVPSSGTVLSGTEVYANHTWTSAGQFTVRVFAYDEAGHQSTASDPTVVTITADTTGPTLNYVPNGSSGWQTSATAITLSATDAQGVQEARYNWDAAAGATTGTVYVNGAIINSPAGNHSLYLWAKDTLNNTSVKGPSLAYQYDDTNPTAPGQPTCTPSPNNTGAHTCTFTASVDTQSGVALYYVYESLNGGVMQLASPATTATSSWTPAPALAAGTYQYQIIAQDSAGRTSGASSLSSNIIVDKTNPNAASCDKPTGSYFPNVAVNCTPGADQGSPTTAVTVRHTTTGVDPTCASSAFSNPTTYSSTTTLKVRTCDAAGNFSAVTTYTYTISGISPITFTFTPPNSSGWQTSATSITLGVSSANGIAQAKYCWSNTGQSCDASVGTVYTNGTIISSPVGNKTVYTWAQDNIGQTNTSNSGPYQYDDTNPSNPGQPTCTPSPNNTGAHTCTFTASVDTQSGVALYYVYESLNGGVMQLASPATTATSSWTPAPALAAGTYQYQIIAQDSAGRTSGASSLSSNIIVDKTNPNAATCAPGSGTYGSAQSVSCSATDAGSPTTTVTVHYTSGATTPPDPTCASPAFTNPTSIATTTVLKVIACDGAGNQSAVTTDSYVIIVNTPPSVTYNPTPASDFYAPFDINSLSLTWSGGDTDSILYKVYISPDAAIEPSDYDGSITVLGGTDYIVYGGPQTKTLNPNTKYYWQVTADDTPLGQPTYPGRPVAGPIWNFTMNSVPVVNGGSINPVVIDKQGTITWQSQDSNNDQNLTFDIYYNTVPGSLVGATKINSTPLAANAVCSGTSNSSGWSCSFVWDSSCVPAAANLYLVIKAMDGYDATIHYNAGSFTIDHTQAKQFPSSGFGTANNDEVVNMQVDDGSVDYSKTPPQVKFRGACLNPKTINPSLQANSALPAASHSGSLNQGEESPYYNLVGLNSGANQLKFTTTNNSCHKTDYQISYNLVTSCGQPYVAVQSGEIYSQGNVRSEYAPPTGNFNASYLILGGGSDAQPKVIENFVAPVADYLKPNFGVVPYPTATTSDQPQIGTFDYYSLTHKADGTVVADGDTNLYGYQVKVWGSAGSTASSSLTIGQGGHNQLDNRVYYFKGSLTIDEALMFRNGSGNKSAAGLIIIDGDLNINNNLSYEVGSYEGTIRNLASVGWMIGGQVAVGGSVGQLVGTFYVAGSSGSGNFNTGSGSGQLNIYGSIIAKQISFNRTFSAPGEPSEKVIMDGRIMVNTPPGFTDLLSTLPAWRFHTP